MSLPHFLGRTSSVCFLFLLTCNSYQSHTWHTMMNRIAGQTLKGLTFQASRCVPRVMNPVLVQRASYSRSVVPRMAMDDLKTGTSAYMDLYPEKSTDGSLRLGNIIPDFSAETTHGKWESFHEWKKGKVNTSMLIIHPTCVSSLTRKSNVFPLSFLFLVGNPFLSPCR